MNIDVRESPNGGWELWINGHLIGTSKQRFDADHAKRVIELAVQNPDEKECL